MDYQRINVIIEGKLKQITAKKGTILLDALRLNDIPIISTCGGNGNCGKCMVKIKDGDCIWKELACKIKVDFDITVEILNIDTPINTLPEITETGKMDGDSAILVADIGTTTLAVALIDEVTGNVVEVKTQNNPQSKYGADIISRIEYVEEGGLDILHNSLINALNRMEYELKNKYNYYKINKMIVCGNTVMLHLFFNEDCSQMGIFPYTPKFLGKKACNSKSIGLDFDTDIESMPCASPFIGADALAVTAIEDTPVGDNDYYLCIDFGTNAEIIIWNKTNAICTSTSAGPCFEGGNLSCGHSATEGAICSASLINNRLEYRTIGNITPKGICGTGIVDLIAILRELDIIDEDGTFVDKKYIENGFCITGNIILTQKDIREFQLAKSAIFSATELLVKQANINKSCIKKVLLSGGFGTNINVKNAVNIGLIPSYFENICYPVGNSALKGAIAYAKRKNTPISKNSTIDICNQKSFERSFIYNTKMIKK